MFIGGFQKVSLVDYPGIIASTIFTSGCNFRCGYCHNPDLVLGKVNSLDMEKIFRYLKEAKGKKIDGVCICGGEPTVHKDLPQFISEIKNLGLKVKLDTNGSNPDILKKCQVDYIAMDVKTSLNDYHKICWVKGMGEKIKESIDYLIHQDKMDYEFRTTLVPGIVGSDELMEISKLLKNAKRWYLQNYSSKKTLDPSFEDIKPYSLETINGLMENLKKTNLSVFYR
jgi:pyruvate formate lyase activating enzyme